MRAPNLDPAVTLIAKSCSSARRCLLVGLSGIDGSGKSFIARSLAEKLRERGLTVHLLSVDPWLAAPEARFDAARPAEHFYERGLRLDEMFQRLVLPLVRHGSATVTFDAADATLAPLTPTTLTLDRADVVLLEGIFIFKRPQCPLFDLRLWVRCSFKTALERALSRGQEGLSREAAQIEYDTTYHAAQKLHLRLDDPEGSSHLVIENDP